MPTIDALLRSLDLQPAGAGRYTAPNADEHGFVFGGQLLGQSIVAARLRHEGKTVKTIHTIFARAAAASSPVEIAIDPIHDGRSFASTGVTVSQGDRVCARSLVLLTTDEPDLIRHGETAPAVPGPEDCPGAGDADGTNAWRVRVVGGVDISDPDAEGPAELDVWTMFDGAPDDPAVDQALVAYATDAFLIGTAMRPHAGVGQRQAHDTLSTGVVGHTLTFHEPLAAGDWFLLSHRSPYAGRGRSYGRADVFGRDGALAASFVQDAMIRPRDPGSARL